MEKSLVTYDANDGVINTRCENLMLGAGMHSFTKFWGRLALNLTQSSVRKILPPSLAYFSKLW